ncbi:putative bifunctional diguanylate cyclase/phosphodiesterase [Flavonifractor hominis]|uniref:GGDEF domain-containing protein n=1 Tax=Flavonifractor hominis TaxID=3133178 RepID=A0ABV1EM83_9FIRM
MRELSQGKKQQHMYLAILLFACFLVGGILFLWHMMSQNESDSLQYLDNAALHQEISVDRQIQGDFQTLHAVAIAMEELGVSELSQVEEMMQKINESNSFRYMGIATVEGQLDLVEIGGERHFGLDVSQEVFFQKAVAGKDAISATRQDPLAEGNYINCYGVPLLNGAGSVVGVLCGINDASVLRSIIDAPLLNSEGFSDLLLQDGRIIIRSQDTPVARGDIRSISDLEGISEQDMEEINTALAEDTKAHFTYQIEGRTMVAVLAPISVPGWYILSSLPQETLWQRYLVTVVGAVFLVATGVLLFFGMMLRERRADARSRAQLERLAYQDKLTQCRNYDKFLLDAEQIFQESGCDGWALWYCDLKHFKYYNDVLGYHMGDALLKRMAEVFLHLEGADAVFCRATADNFVGLHREQDPKRLRAWFDQVVEELTREESQVPNRVCVELCMGFFLPEPQDVSLAVQEMVDRANMAQKSIKQQAGSGCAFYNEQIREYNRRDMELGRQGMQALREGQFQIYVQPKVDIQRGDRLSGGEVLARWLHPQRGMVPPGEFIPLFEENGMIVDLDRAMFRQSCQWLRARMDRGEPPVSLAVNVSRLSLLREDFVEYYAAVKRQFAIPDGVVELEFTESMALVGEEMFLDLAHSIQQAGFICTMDDFGTGYSSLNLLKNLPINVLKLDIMFFRKSIDKRRERIVVRNIIQMAKELDIRVVAEGVEAEESLEFLRAAGCDIAQGYLFAKPMPLEQFERLVEEKKDGPWKTEE